eukprot:TRINITY_DN2486_c0_g1_i4.p1 TRINITY_DN2486_c0_g1~~TRINITY_DN2486_c0_g1_i4.p1  ORF type:complete len:425 (+),score=99.29 TRINITY_DN2486_c0_g1_i4:690-1964(+)
MPAARAVATVVSLVVASALARETVHSVHTFDVGMWTAVGDASVYDNYVRLVPDRQAKKGALWNMQPVDYSDWEVEFSFRIHGVSQLGADGLAFWYADEPAVCGTVFGNKELFSGLGVIIDTYDNDGKGLHPYVFGLVNDGTRRFSFQDHDHQDHTSANYEPREGAVETGELNGCTVKMRGLPMPSSLLVNYSNKSLTVSYRLTPNSEWKQCFTVPKITLKTGGFFGFSAGTGDLADNHDIYDVTARDLSDTGGDRAAAEAVAAAAAAAAGLPSVQSLRTDLGRLQRSVQADLAAAISPLRSAALQMQSSLDKLVDTISKLVATTGKPAVTTPPTTPGSADTIDSTTKTMVSQITTQLSNAREATEIARRNLKEAQKLANEAVTGGGRMWHLYVNLVLGACVLGCGWCCLTLARKLSAEKAKKLC